MLARHPWRPPTTPPPRRPPVLRLTACDIRRKLSDFHHLRPLTPRIPGGARWAYVFGSVLLFLFISQTITGIFLALYYAPTADHAHTTVAYIVKEVTGGSFLRSLHAYGSSAVVIVMLLHLTQTFLYGAYKGRREVLWISGCALLGLMLAMAFTGYLLPWDQKAYFATTVGTNMASEVPLIAFSYTVPMVVLLPFTHGIAPTIIVTGFLENLAKDRRISFTKFHKS